MDATGLGIPGISDVTEAGGNPATTTYLATDGYTTHAIESLGGVLFGDINPVGRLPVTIPGADGSGALYPFGHGLGYDT